MAGLGGRRSVAAENAPRNEGGRFAAEYPTDGAELLRLWELPSESLMTESVKISRCIAGTSQTELLRSLPMSDFRLEDVVADFGPGRYLVKPGPGPNSAKTCTLNISQEYARGAGWQEMPVVRPVAPSDVFLRQRMEQAALAPTNPVDMALMIELAVQKALNAQAPRTADPTGGLMSGFELAFKMLTQAKEFIDPNAAAVERAPASIGDALITHLPSILDTVQKGIGALAIAGAAKQAQPAPQPMPMAPRPAPAPMPTIEAQPVETIAEESHPMPELTQEQADAISPVVGLMREFGPTLANLLGMPVPAETLGGQLAGLIGPDVESSALALADIVAEKGPGILGAIHPKLGTEKAAQVVKFAAANIRESLGDE